MSDQVVSDVVRTLLAEADEDYIGLWMVPSGLRLRLPHATADEIRRLGEPVVRGLVDDGLVVGELVSGCGFVAWDVPDHVAATMAFWDGLGRDPNLGDDIWFDRSVLQDRPDRADSE